MQIRGVPKAEGQLRGLVKTPHRRAAPLHILAELGRVLTRVFDTPLPTTKAEFRKLPR